MEIINTSRIQAKVDDVINKDSQSKNTSGAYFVSTLGDSSVLPSWLISSARMKNEQSAKLGSIVKPSVCMEVKALQHQHEEFRTIYFDQNEMERKFNLPSDGFCMAASARWASTVVDNQLSTIDQRRAFLESESFVRKCQEGQRIAEDASDLVDEKFPDSPTQSHYRNALYKYTNQLFGLERVGKRHSFENASNNTLLSAVSKKISNLPGTYVVSAWPEDEDGCGHTIALKSNDGVMGKFFDPNEGEFDAPLDRAPELLEGFFGRDPLERVDFYAVKRKS